jgi:hypothetical protein
MLYAIEKGHEAAAKVCREIETWALEVGRPKSTSKLLVTPEGVDAAVAAAVGPELAAAMAIGVKQQRGAAVEKIRNQAIDELDEKTSGFKVRRAARHPFSDTTPRPCILPPCHHYNRIRLWSKCEPSHTNSHESSVIFREGSFASWAPPNVAACITFLFFPSCMSSSRRLPVGFLTRLPAPALMRRAPVTSHS